MTKPRINRNEFEQYLENALPQDVKKWLSITDFELKLLLKSMNEIQDAEEVYDIDDLDVLVNWKVKIKSEPSWMKFDEQHNGKISKALNLYYKFIEYRDVSQDPNKRMKPSRPLYPEDSDNLPSGYHVSHQRETITIDSDEDVAISEGRSIDAHVTRYERSSLARELCIRAYGNTYRCEVCGFTFSSVYGPRKGKQYIEVHHIIEHAERSQNEGTHEVNYRTELIPLCANCHRMIHFLTDRTLHPSELKKIIETYKNHGKA